MENNNKFILKTYDGDIYILQGYSSAEEITDRMANLEWATMPNGARRRVSEIKSVTSIEDYKFQQEQKDRHKKGQYLRGGELQDWYDHAGLVTGSNVKSITGVIKNLPQLPVGNSLTGKKK